MSISLVLTPTLLALPSNPPSFPFPPLPGGRGGFLSSRHFCGNAARRRFHSASGTGDSDPSARFAGTSLYTREALAGRLAMLGGGAGGAAWLPVGKSAFGPRRFFSGTARRHHLFLKKRWWGRPFPAWKAGSPVLRPAAAFSRPSLWLELLPPSKWYWESNPSAHCVGSSLSTREPCKARLRRDFIRAAVRQKTVRLRRDL